MPQINQGKKRLENEDLGDSPISDDESEEILEGETPESRSGFFTNAAKIEECYRKYAIEVMEFAQKKSKSASVLPKQLPFGAKSALPRGALLARPLMAKIPHTSQKNKIKKVK